MNPNFSLSDRCGHDSLMTQLELLVVVGTAGLTTMSTSRFLHYFEHGVLIACHANGLITSAMLDFFLSTTESVEFSFQQVTFTRELFDFGFFFSKFFFEERFIRDTEGESFLNPLSWFVFFFIITTTVGAFLIIVIVILRCL